MELKILAQSNFAAIQTVQNLCPKLRIKKMVVEYQYRVGDRMRVYTVQVISKHDDKKAA